MKEHITKKIYHLRNKPDHVKQRILIVTMVMFGVVILGVWLVTFHPSVSGTKDIVPFANNVGKYISNNSNSITGLSANSSDLFSNSNPSTSSDIIQQNQ